MLETPESSTAREGSTTTDHEPSRLFTNNSRNRRNTVSYGETQGEAAAAAGQGNGYTVEQSWETLLKKVDDYDDDTVKNWKEDIDTLLVFAGLFSAVVTAFLIESYQWLEEDTGDVTVSLLKQISQQIHDPQFTPEEPEAFRPSALSVRINCFWFLSLILSLMSGLLGLLCKQWLREHMRDVPTQNPAETLALRQLRRDSLDQWRVPQFVATTPILLEMALLLFFAGLLELAWTRHLALFVVCVVAVGLGGGVYIVTTFLPLAVNIYADVSQKDNEFSPFRFICPYKSPQAWAVYRFSCMILRRLPLIRPSLVKRGYKWQRAVTPPKDWPFSDIRVLTGFQNPFLKVYELRALEWATRMFQDTPSTIPHFQNVLGSSSYHPRVAMTAILNYLTLAMWEDFTPSDVQEELRDMRKFKESRRQGLGWYMIVSRPPELPDPILHSEVGIRVLSHHNYWHSLVEDATPTTVRNLEDSISSFRRKKFDRAINLRFFVPFGIVGKLWAHPNPTVQEESLSLIQLYRDSWDAYPGPEEKGDERLAFLVALTKHLKLRGNDGVHRSCLLTGVQGREFIQFIRSEIIRRRLNECPYWEPDQSRRRALIETWNEATRNVTGLTPIPVPETVSSFTSVEVSNHGGTTDLGDTSIEV